MYACSQVLRKEGIMVSDRWLKVGTVFGIIACVAFALACGGGGSGGGSSGGGDSGGEVVPTPTPGGGGPGSVYEDVPTEFNVSGAKLLLAQKNTVETVKASNLQKTSSDGRTLFTYKITSEGLEKPSKAEDLLDVDRVSSKDEEGGSNLLAVDAEGNAWLAIESGHPVKVMYSATDPAGEYVYLALDNGWWGEWDGNDYTRFIAQENSAFFRVKIADDTWEPVLKGVFVQKMDQNYMQAISSNQKPIQFDDAGNMFFAATEFTREENSWEEWYWDEELQQDVSETRTEYWIHDTTWMPRIYRMANDTGEITTITQDIQAVDYFLVLPTGEIAYHSYDQYGGTNDRLWMWQEGTTIDLSSSALGNWGVDFFTVDTSNVVMWGEWNTRGIWFARPHTAGGVEKAVLDTNLFGGNQHGDSKPRRVIVGDDGRLYGLFESHLWDHEKQQGFTVLSVYQILPYDGVPKLELTLSDNWFWWDWMRETPFQISKGYLYYVDTIDPGDYLGTRDVVKMVYLSDRTTSQILDTGEGRYEIYSWRLSGDILYFSALNKATTTVVSGEIDTVKVRDGETVDEFLTITETASALGAVSQIQDIEILTPQQPDTDTGSAPVVQQFHTSSENLYSISMDFSKYMDKTTVESNLEFVDAADAAIANMKIWIYKSLHLVPDLDVTGLGDSSTTSPLAFATAYTVTLGDGTRDAYSWDLGDADGTLPKTKTFTTKGEYGWYYSANTDCAVAAVSDGGVAKYAGPEAEWTKETFALHLDVPDNVRIEFSAKNYRWEGLNIILWNRTEWSNDPDPLVPADWLADDNSDNQDNWDAMVAHYRLGNWSNLDYKTARSENSWTEWDYQQEKDVTRTDYWYENNWKDGNTPKLFNGTWMSYQLNVYGTNMDLYYSEDGVEWTEVEAFSVTDLMNRLAGCYHSVLLRSVDPIVIDNLKISTLTAAGALDGAEGDVLDLDFAADILVDDPGDVADDGQGFDDDLNSLLFFDMW